MARPTELGLKRYENQTPSPHAYNINRTVEGRALLSSTQEILTLG